MRLRRRIFLCFGVLFLFTTLSCAAYPPPAPTPMPEPEPGPVDQTPTPPPAPPPPAGCDRLITAKVFALDQPYFLNRLGAMLPEGMVYALERDVVASSCPSGQTCKPSKGNARLRFGKRPRPIVLRANVGDCLSIEFTNLLSDVPADENGIKGVQPSTRWASIHVAGMQNLNSISDDGSFVGVNPNSLVPPGGQRTYVLKATAEGTFLLNSEGAAWGGLNQPNDGAQVTAGLFGCVNVEPKKAVWLRSQLTYAEMQMASKGNTTTLGQPVLDYSSPVLHMLDPVPAPNVFRYELVATDLTAIIAGPKENGYVFPESNDPNTSPVPYEPQRRQPFREFSIMYHELNNAQQAFPIFEYPNASLTKTLQAGGEEFAINYGTGGIAAEILANRFGLGPMNSCADCRFEEFFLSSWTVGDPAMIVDHPANAKCTDNTLNDPALINPNLIAPWAPVQCRLGVKGNAPKDVQPLRKATKTLYPEDPSNVYHSYINDRVVFRTLHSGTGVSHVHHLHAHQWFHSPNADGSTYLDSQLINPGSAYTMEIAHLGSGNKNKVVGDSIFHCHFYPHFAAGMWAHWRSHDVYEVGTKLDSDGKPLSGYNRVLPDGEILAGSPIPALVPMPSLPMPVMPAEVQIVAVADPNNPAPGNPVVGWQAVPNPGQLAQGMNPGFPFFIPGVGGTRAPHPPMDFAVDKGKTLDGGLPRHLLLAAKISKESHNYLNFEKDIDDVVAFQLPEDGTDVEKVAMKFHEQCTHATFLADGLGTTPAKFRTNGLPAVSGAPYADPGLLNPSDSDTCTPIKDWIEYRAAVVQTDTIFNKIGWHYPQARLLTLWGDAVDTVTGKKPPEPFFIRANSRTGVNYWHTNLVPAYYLLDDFQVRTPTDIIGQHIHLVKFDVTSSDGAANGFNYEDGTLSYQEVQELIHGINDCGGLAKDMASVKPCGNPCDPNNPGPGCLTAQPPPAEICQGNATLCKKWKGAQTTVQRWYADPLDSPADKVNGERTLRTVFTHDHFGPSTHQQVGLYAALVVEPTGSKWFLNDAAKTPMRDPARNDGGPTSWQAIIETPGADEKNTYREFNFALQDFQLAYQATSISQTKKDVTGQQTEKDGSKHTVSGGESWADPCRAIEAPQIQGTTGAKDCPKYSATKKAALGPQLISAGPTPGTSSFNYRNEPLPFRVAPPASGSGGDPKATDLSYVFSSRIKRNIAALNSQPTPGTAIAPNSAFKFPPALQGGLQGRDPYTPMIRAYEGDRVQMRVIVGAHMLPHDFTVHGMKWLFEPSFANSGYRSNQSMGISEHFEFLFETPRASPSSDPEKNWSDYLYMPDSSNQNHGIIDGTWGLFRAYKTKQADLPLLPTNQDVKPLPKPSLPSGYSCPPNAPVRAFTINAATVPKTQIPFNSRGVDGAGKFPSTTIFNAFPLMYTYLATTPPGGAATNVVSNIDEPLILRANAGECVAVTLENELNKTAPVFSQQSFAKFDPFHYYPLKTSPYAGVTAALMSYDVMSSAGMNIGFNPEQTVANGNANPKTYYWYAGQTKVSSSGAISGTAIEFGGVNLTPSDPLQQDRYGLVGGMVVEPPNTVACMDVLNPRASPAWLTYASGTVYDGGTCANPGPLRYREFVIISQTDLSNLTWPAACYCPAKTPQTGADCTPCFGPVENAIAAPLLRQSAINYRVEPMTYRFNATTFVNLDYVWRAYSDAFVLGEPQTPIFAAARNTPVRFHLIAPGGSGDQQVIALHGHVWQELPFTSNSTSIGSNPFSQWLGKRDNFGTNTAYPIILEENGGAGGLNGVMGDYLYRTTPANFLTQGWWGIFRVGKSGADTVSIAHATFSGGGLQVSGSSTVFLDSNANAKNGQRAQTVSLFTRPKGSTGPNTALPGGTDVKLGEAGLWSYNSGSIDMPDAGSLEVVAISPLGGQAVLPITTALLPVPPPNAQSTDPYGESIRFVNTPRTNEGEPEVPEAKPELGHQAPPPSGGATPPPPEE